MRFFHLSDLHLGKRVNEFSMIEDQEFILKEILTVIGEEKPDALLIAGDIYDRTVPSEDAMRLWDSFLVSLAKKKIPVYAIYGNHDSAVRLSDHAALVERMGIHLSTEYNGSAQHFTLEDALGTVHLYLLPFIKPSTVRPHFPEDVIRDYTDACRIAIEKMDIDPDARNVLIAHQFVAGAATCDSEEIIVGGLDQVDVSVFDPFDYVALGHLHGRQSVGRREVRYCGTPLKYSISEKDHQKSITVVELGEKGSVSIDEIPLKPRHDLREIRGTYEELTLKENYENTATDDYIHAVLTDEEDVIDAVGKLRRIYPNLIRLSYDNRRTREQQEITDITDAEQKTPFDLFADLYEKQNNGPMSEEQKAFALECIESIWEA